MTDKTQTADDVKTQNQACLDALLLEVIECSACDLRTTCRGIVFGEGAPDAQVMAIGEAPGAEEDAQSRPFVGKAGQLLDQMLAAAGFNRSSNVYIANIVKCRPPTNRVPLPHEIQACLPHLRAQFRILRPKLVLLLGATAYKAIIDPKGSITTARGSWVEKGNVAFMPTYHPAALLRNPALKRPAWQDLQELTRRYSHLIIQTNQSATPAQ